MERKQHCFPPSLSRRNKPGQLRNATSHKFLLALATLSIVASILTPAKGQESDKLTKLYQKVISSVTRDMNEADSLDREFKKLIAAQNPPHDSILVKAYFLDAVLNLYKGRYFLAEKYFNDILAMSSGVESNLLKEICYNNLGVIYHKNNLLSKAFDANLGLAEKVSLTN